MWRRSCLIIFIVPVSTLGEVLGSCAAIRQKEGLYFVGLYAVRTKLQGRGIGMKMWDYAMKRVGDSNAGLNAVPKHLSNYR